MKDSLQELAQEFCHLPERDFSSSKSLAARLFNLLTKIDDVLKAMSTRFIDIDPSAKVDENQKDSFLEMIEMLSDDSIDLDSLFEIYESLSQYLLMKDRFGEAADWFLKNEYDSQLSDTIADILLELEVI